MPPSESSAIMRQIWGVPGSRSRRPRIVAARDCVRASMLGPPVFCSPSIGPIGLFVRPACPLFTGRYRGLFFYLGLKSLVAALHIDRAREGSDEPVTLASQLAK